MYRAVIGASEMIDSAYHRTTRGRVRRPAKPTARHILQYYTRCPGRGGARSVSHVRRKLCGL